MLLFLAKIKDNLQSVWNVMTGSTVCYATESLVEMVTAPSPINSNTKTHLACTFKENVNIIVQQGGLDLIHIVLQIRFTQNDTCSLHRKIMKDMR